MGGIDFRSIIIDMDDKRVKYLKRIFNKKPVKVIREPATGLVMMAVRDTFNVDFYLGEVLVTEAEVEYEGIRGYGMVIGEKPEKAFILAIIDAVFQGKNEILKKRLVRFLAVEKDINEKKLKLQESLIEKTRVDFQLMPKG